MKHRDCGGHIILVASEMYELVSPSLSITTRGISPGILELSTKKGGSFKLLCSQCGEIFSSKEEFEEEVIESCSFCKGEKSPSELLVSDMFAPICKSCRSKTPERKPAREQTMTDKLLIMYSEYLKNSNMPTLLSILTKKVMKGDL